MGLSTPPPKKCCKLPLQKFPLQKYHTRWVENMTPPPRLSKRSPTWSIRLASLDLPNLMAGTGHSNPSWQWQQKQEKNKHLPNLSKSYVSWTWQRSYFVFVIFFYTLQEIHQNTAIVQWPWNILIFPGNTIITGVFFTKNFLCFFVKCWGQGSLRACRLYMPHFAKWKKDVESLPATCGSHCGRPKDVQKTDLADDLPWLLMVFGDANSSLPFANPTAPPRFVWKNHLSGIIPSKGQPLNFKILPTESSSRVWNLSPKFHPPLKQTVWGWNLTPKGRI